MKFSHPAYMLIFMPWILASLFATFPMLSYLIAWLGSFFIFYITLGSGCSVYGTVEQRKNFVMRPICLLQLVFAGFMCSTSIFYFIAHIDQELGTIATCQRLALLGHASIVSGMMICIKNKKHQANIYFKNLPLVVVKVCMGSLTSGFLLNYLPGLIQFKYPLLVLSATTGSFALIHGLKRRSFFIGVFGFMVTITFFINATLTGFKEGIIVQFITIIFLAFPYYKKTIAILSFPCVYLLLYFLPTYTNIMRETSWKGGKSKENAREYAYETFFNENNENVISETNWKFLTNRLSEIGMFTKYVSYVPEFHNFYGLEIIRNSLLALVPRTLWNNKPSTELISMQRVYDAGIVDKSSEISAKSRPIVDGYLMYGNIGVFLSMLLYGILTQSICNKAENLFGGYDMGCVVIFNSLFQQLWRGNNFEFLINNVFYAYLLMYLIYGIMRVTNCFSINIYDHTRNAGI